MLSAEQHKKKLGRTHRPAVALVVTLVILVALCSIAYTLGSRIAAQRHRDRYMIDYGATRYACDSGLKYAIATVETINVDLIARPNEPDFSDLFHLAEEQYQQLIDRSSRAPAVSTGPNEPDENNDVNEANEIDYLKTLTASGELDDANSITIRGPYGPPWPLIAEPIEFQIGSAAIKIEIHDENAKMPIGWSIIHKKDVHREARAALETFCEWMEMDYSQIHELQSQLKEVAEIKQFRFNPSPITIPEKVAQRDKKTRKIPSLHRRPRRRRARWRRRRSRARAARRRRPMAAHTTDFARLFHSSLIDTEALAAPVIVGEERNESALKYLGLWGSKRVNINTAPRHVLEAAFTFGGDAGEVAEEIIQRRRISPFADIKDLKKSLFPYRDSVEKAEPYITTKSTFFTIRVTARSGVAKASAVAAVTKQGKKVQKIAVISG